LTYSVVGTSARSLISLSIMLANLSEKTNLRRNHYPRTLLVPH
jgi:hypothetical protein